MPLNIKDPETHDLARKIATITGDNLSKTVKQALRDKLHQLENAGASEMKTLLISELDDIAKHCSRLPRRDDRSAEAIIGYDDLGLPS